MFVFFPPVGLYSWSEKRNNLRPGWDDRDFESIKQYDIICLILLLENFTCPLKRENFKRKISLPTIIFPQQQNAMGSLHNIDFGVLGSSGKEPGSGNRFQFSMGSAGGASRLRWVPTGSGVRKVVPRFEWVLTGSGFPRFANWFRELVPGFDRFQGSESGNAVPRGIVKPPCCWGYHPRLFFGCYVDFQGNIFKMESNNYRKKRQLTDSSIQKKKLPTEMY